MPTEQNNINKIEEVLGSLDHVQKAEAPAFFYTRLIARMEQENAVGPVTRLLGKPALALTLAAVILVVNATAILEMWKDNRSTSSSDSQQIVSADYPMSTYPVYDENNAEP